MSRELSPSLLLITCYLLLATLLVGCGRVEEKADILLWHWMTDREDAFHELARRYEGETGVRVGFELYAPSGTYSQKVIAAAQANTLPDIFGILGERRVFASFIKAGHVADLSQQMEADNGAWRNVLFAKAVAMNEFLAGNEFGVPPGIYGVPIDVMNIQMLYNKDLFSRADLDPEYPPESWEEFIEAGKKLKAAGIQGLISGWGEIWMIDCLASNFAWNLMGEAKIIATIKGEVPYTDPDWVRVFGLFKEMADSGILATGIVTMVNKSAEQDFSNERAAIAFNGSWCVNVYQGMNPDLNYATMLVPEVSKEFPVAIWGGAGSSFMVNAKSKKKEEAIKFLGWLTEVPQQVFLTEATLNLPANKYSVAVAEVPPILREFANSMDRTIHPSLLPVAEFPLVIETFDKGIQSIIIGEKTPEEVAFEVQAAKVRELAKRR